MSSLSELSKNLKDIKKDTVDISESLSSIKQKIVGDTINTLESKKESLQTKTASLIDEKELLERDDSKDNITQIKDNLSSVEVNSKTRLLKHPLEKVIDKNFKTLFLFEKQIISFGKEQVQILNEIKSSLVRRLPPDLEEKTSEKIDVLKMLESDNSNNNGGSIIPDVDIDINKKAKDTPDKSKKESKKETKKAKKDSKFKLSGATKGLGALALAGSAYTLYKLHDGSFKEQFAEEFADIDEKEKSGEITPFEANKQRDELNAEISKQQKEETVSEVGSFGGGLAGAAAGAALGSAIFPGIGTAVGAIAGGIGGSEIGSNLSKLVNGDTVGKAFDTVHKGISSVGSTLANVNPQEYISSAIQKTNELVGDLSKSYENAKNFISTDIIDAGSKKVDDVISSAKDMFNIDSITNNITNEISKLGESITSFVPSIPSIGKMSTSVKTLLDENREAEMKMADAAKNVKGASEVFVNNITNNQTSFVPVKNTPRAEYFGSALERYTNKTASF